MFLTPFGRLVQESVGRYSLLGTVVVPGNGLLIQALDFSSPPHVTLPANFFPVQVVIEATKLAADKDSLIVRMPLDFQATGLGALPVGGATGLTHVALFVVLGTAVVGSAVIRVPELSGPIFPEVTPLPPCETWGWVAWRNVGSIPLHVQGYFEAESFGYAGKLTVASPQGIDPEELLLNLVFRSIDGVFPRVCARIPVQFDDPNPPLKYRRVSILYPSGAACQIPVRDLG